MRHTGGLDVLLDGLGGTLSSDNVDELTGRLGLDTSSSAQLVALLEEFADWDGEQSPDGEFEFRVGSWELDLTRELIRSSILTAMLAVVLSTIPGGVGFAAIGVAVIPSLMDIKRASLTDGERQLLIEVQRRPALTSKFLTVDDIYAGLPAEVQSQINRFDFANFIGALKRLGLAEPERVTGTVRVRAGDEKAPLITWRT